MKKYIVFFVSCFLFVYGAVLPFALAVENDTRDVVTLDNPLGEITSVPDLTGNIIKVALGVMGSLALLAFVYGAFLWLTSAGKEEKVSTGTKAMLFATIGIFVIFSAYAILSTLFNLLGV